jgi:hypothetical protein
MNNKSLNQINSLKKPFSRNLGFNPQQLACQTGQMGFGYSHPDGFS